GVRAADEDLEAAVLVRSDGDRRRPFASERMPAGPRAAGRLLRVPVDRLVRAEREDLELSFGIEDGRRLAGQLAAERFPARPAARGLLPLMIRHALLAEREDLDAPVLVQRDARAR